MKKFKLLSFLLIISLFVTLLAVPAAAVPEPTVNAQSAVVIDADTGDVMYQLNADQRFSPAEMTMVMTALMTADAIQERTVALSDQVTASEEIYYNVTDNSVTMDPAMKPGETLSVEDLLYALFLQSATEACNALAEHVAGSVNTFVAGMNRRAQELGCRNTHFVNANGRPAEDQYTTAMDMAVIARQLVGNAQILGISGAATHTVEATDQSNERVMTNRNEMVTPASDLYFDRAYGIKNGYDEGYGRCMVAAAEWNEVNVIAVVIGCPEVGDQFRAARSLFDWVFANFSYRPLLSTTQVLDTIEVELGSPGSVGVRAESGMSLILPNDQQLGDVRYEVQYAHEQEGRKLEAPINAGEYLGTVEVFLDGESYGTSRLVAATSVEISRVEYMRTQLKGMFQTPAIRQIVTVLIILLAIYLLLMVFYFVQRFRHLHSLRVAKKDRAIAQAQREAQWIDDPDDEDDYDGPAGYIDRPEDGAQDEDGYDDGPAPRGAHSADEDYFDSYFKG